MAASAADVHSRSAAGLARLWSSRGAGSNALVPLAVAFGLVTAARRWLFRKGWRAAHRLPVPVVVIGNLLVGGAGKTPAVIAVVELLRRHGWTPGVVSRGYGRSETGTALVGQDSLAQDVGDEPMLLWRRTRAPVAVGSDRVAAGHALLQAQPHVDVIVSDDGLQHLALDRDLEIVVFDDRGLGNGRLLPAGPLRERPAVAPTVPRIVLYNAAAPSTAAAGYVGHRSLSGLTGLAAWWQGAPADPAALDALRGRPVVAAAGLARPGRFFAMLREQGLDVTELPLADHADFRVLPWPVGTADVVVTEKDAVKITPDRRIGSRVWVAALDFQPEPAFEAALVSALPRPIAPTSNHPNDPHGSPPA